MIPYFEVGPVHLGPFDMQPFGILVLAGIAAFLLAAHYRGLALGLYTEHTVLGAMAVVGGSIVGGHVFAAIFYYPERLAGNWAHLLQFTQGQSLFGGLIGGTIAGLAYLLVRGFPILLFTEPFVYGTVASLVLGRLGCTLAHDHPGQETTFFLAVSGWPDGKTRHDLGLYEFLFMVGLMILLYVIRNRRSLPGLQVALPMILYAPLRFGLDFLRTVDLRHGGLTFAQYGCLVMFVGGILILVHGWRLRRILADLAPATQTVPKEFS